MNHTMDKNTTTFLTVATVVAGITIIATAISLRPPSCVDDRVTIADLKQQIVDITASKPYIQPGTCHFYSEQEQEVCRKEKGFGGTIYVRERNNEGATISNIEGE